MFSEHAGTFAALLGTLFVAHQVADHWVQSSTQSSHKGLPGRAGALACARHVATYTATLTVFVLAAWALLDLPINLGGIVVGQLISAITHYWADRRYTLERLAELADKAEFYRLGAPRPGRGDNPSLGTGAYALDQSWHHAWLWVAAIVTTLL